MKSLRFLALALVMLVLAAGTALASDIEQYKTNVQSALTKDKITSMMEVAKLLKQYGASYQQPLTSDTALAGKLKPGEALRVMIGMYQFDAVYAAAYGRKKDAVGFLEARARLVDKMNLRGRLDVSALFPQKLDTLLKNPDGATFDDIVQAYAENAAKYEEMMNDQVGFETIEASLYGFVLEGLYVTSNSLLTSGMDPELMQVVGHVVPLIQPALSLYESFTSVEHYAMYVDPDNFLERTERAAWLKIIMKMIIDKKAKLTEKQVKAIVEIVSKERAAIYSTMP